MNGKLILDRKTLISLRADLGLSQEALADACIKNGLQLSIASIKRAESEKKVLYRTARAYAQYFKVPIAKLT